MLFRSAARAKGILSSIPCESAFRPTLLISPLLYVSLKPSLLKHSGIITSNQEEVTTTLYQTSPSTVCGLFPGWGWECGEKQEDFPGGPADKNLPAGDAGCPCISTTEPVLCNSPGLAVCITWRDLKQSDSHSVMFVEFSRYRVGYHFLLQ